MPFVRPSATALLIRNLDHRTFSFFTRSLSHICTENYPFFFLFFYVVLHPLFFHAKTASETFESPAKSKSRWSKVGSGIVAASDVPRGASRPSPSLRRFHSITHLKGKDQKSQERRTPSSKNRWVGNYFTLTPGIHGVKLNC